MMLPPRFEGTLLLEGHRQLGYAEYGRAAGLPLVWCHGTPGARRQIPPGAREAALELGLRLIAVERPGIGASTPHLYGSIVEWAADIRRLCDALEFDRVGLIGLSGGGPYALACAHEMPERVFGVAVLGGVAPAAGAEAAPGGVSDFVRATSPFLRLGHVPLAEALRGLIRVLEPVREQALDVFSSFMPPGDQRVFADSGIRRMFIDDMLVGSRHQMRALLFDAILFGRPWGFSLGDIRVPVHLWYGDADVIVPLSHGEHIAERIPDAVLRIRPEEGHLGGLGASREILEALLDDWIEAENLAV